MSKFYTVIDTYKDKTNKAEQFASNSRRIDLRGVIEKQQHTEGIEWIYLNETTCWRRSFCPKLSKNYDY